MYSKIVILNFPPVTAQKAIVCQLTKKFDLLFNILSARISNKKEGYMVIDLSSDSKAAFNKGIKYLKDQNVSISYPEHQIYCHLPDKGNGIVHRTEPESCLIKNNGTQEQSCCCCIKWRNRFACFRISFKKPIQKYFRYSFYNRV